MSEKLEVIHNQPELFGKFKKALNRGHWLSASVILCSNCVEVYLLPLGPTSTEMTTVTTFIGYSEETLAAVNGLLDTRARALKDRWFPHYQLLNESADTEWAIGLDRKDYAVLEIGSTENLRHYRLAWSFEGLQEAADYLSARSDTFLTDDDE